MTKKELLILGLVGVGAIGIASGVVNGSSGGTTISKPIFGKSLYQQGAGSAEKNIPVEGYTFPKETIPSPGFQTITPGKLMEFFTPKVTSGVPSTPPVAKKEGPVTSAANKQVAMNVATAISPIPMAAKQMLIRSGGRRGGKVTTKKEGPVTSAANKQVAMNVATAISPIPMAAKQMLIRSGAGAQKTTPVTPTAKKTKKEKYNMRTSKGRRAAYHRMKYGR
jgi:hypothetical protein